jgi:hypothetical protein
MPLEICAAADETTIKTDGQNFMLYISGQEVERSKDYNTVAKLATDIHVSRFASNDEMIGRRMFAPASMGESGPVIVVAKTKGGYLVQKAGSQQRFEILPEFLSEMPAQYFK